MSRNSSFKIRHLAGEGPMSAHNPYVGQPASEAAWQQGYESGYAEPEVDHAAVLPEELRQAYDEGVLAGRDVRRAEVEFGPLADQGESKVGNGDQGNNKDADEFGHLFLEVAVHVGAERLFEAVGGLAALVI